MDSEKTAINWRSLRLGSSSNKFATMSNNSIKMCDHFQRFFRKKSRSSNSFFEQTTAALRAQSVINDNLENLVKVLLWNPDTDLINVKRTRRIWKCGTLLSAAEVQHGRLSLLDLKKFNRNEECGSCTKRLIDSIGWKIEAVHCES